MVTKDVVPGFERYYGRLSMQLGANLTPLYYVDPPTEVWQDSVTAASPVAGDGTQIWIINPGLGVDTHPLHWHLFNLEVINRIGTDGVIRPPDPNEQGWRETVRINPFELLVVAARPISPKTNFGLPDSIRPLSPTEPIGSTMGFSNVLPGGGVTSVTNQLFNFGYEYVWHCHILSHEENDMMRPVSFIVNTTIPAVPTLAVTTVGGNHLSWNDATPATAPNLGNPANEVGFQILRAPGATGTFAVIAKVPANTVTYIDASAVNATQYRYQVNAYNNKGTSASSNTILVTTVGTVALPAVPALTAPAAAAVVSKVAPISFSWGAVTGATSYTLQILSGATVVVNMPGLIAPNINVQNSVVLPAGAYTWQVSSTGPKGSSAFSTARAFSIAAAPAAPVLSAPATGSAAIGSAPIVLTWGAVSGATSYAVQVTLVGSSTPAINVSGLVSPTYTIRAGALASGTYNWTATATNTGGTSPSSTSFAINVTSHVAADFDNDGKTDVSIYRPTDGSWWVSKSSNGASVLQPWGQTGDIPVPGDYDGDGKTDYAIFRPSTGQWWIIQSSNGVIRLQQWGQTGDIPVPGDYDGDGKTDIAIYRPTDGNWWIIQSNTSTIHLQWWGGTAGDVPVPADYDGDGKTDIAIFRPSTGAWWIIQSATSTVKAQGWGQTGDIPVPADYDGDGKADIAIYRPADGNWWIIQSNTSTIRLQWWGGTAGDIPAPGDYDGDGKADITIFRPSTATWWIIQSTNSTVKAQGFGLTGDTPLPGVNY
jgi:hypothetical protein